MLTLDEPDSLINDGAGRPPVWATGDVSHVEHLFMTVRAWCEHLPRPVSGDSDPLYTTHGDPRD